MHGSTGGAGEGVLYGSRFSAALGKPRDLSPVSPTVAASPAPHPTATVRTYPDQLGEVQPGDDAGGSVVVVVVVAIVVVGAVIPASTTFRYPTVLVWPSTVRLSV